MYRHAGVARTTLLLEKNQNLTKAKTIDKEVQRRQRLISVRALRILHHYSFNYFYAQRFRYEIVVNKQ